MECDTAEELLQAMARCVKDGVAFAIPGQEIAPSAKAPERLAPAPAPAREAKPPTKPTRRKRVYGTRSKRGEKTRAQVAMENRNREALRLDTQIIQALKAGPLTSAELSEAMGLASHRAIVHVMRRLTPWHRRNKSKPRYLGTGTPKTWHLQDCGPVKIAGVDPDATAKANPTKPARPRKNVHKLIIRESEAAKPEPPMPAPTMRHGITLEDELRQKRIDAIKAGDFPLTLGEISPGAVSFMCPEALAVAGFISTHLRWNPDSKIRPYICLSRGESHSCWVPLSSREAPPEYRIGPEAKDGGSIGWRTRPSWMWERTPVLLLDHTQALAAGKKENSYPGARCRVNLAVVDRLRATASQHRFRWANYARERMEILGVAWWVGEQAKGGCLTTLTGL